MVDDHTRLSNGRSLGGHMRSHLSLDDATLMDDDDDPKKTWRLSDDDYGSEEQSDSEVSAVTKNGKRRRRRRRLRRVAAITYDSCSVSVSESEKEDGALSLMMLSRDHYCSIGVGLPKKTYKCATCDRVFGSYQALGGHRTSHRNDSSSASSLSEKRPTQQRSAGAGAVVYECPVCHKVFPSGQALGGHKRRHASSRSLHI